MPHCREWFAPKAFVIRTLPPPAGAVRWWLVASITGQRRRVVGCHGLVIVVQQDSGTLDGVQRRPGAASQVPTAERLSPGRARRLLEPRSGTWLAALGNTSANTVSPNQCILSRSTQGRRRTPVMELRREPTPLRRPRRPGTALANTDVMAMSERHLQTEQTNPETSSGAHGARSSSPLRHTPRSRLRANGKQETTDKPPVRGKRGFGVALRIQARLSRSRVRV